jgi:hypothetical protein
MGLRDLRGDDAVPADSLVRRRGLFGLTPTALGTTLTGTAASDARA